jgi:hypothetical protein
MGTDRDTQTMGTDRETRTIGTDRDTQVLESSQVELPTPPIASETYYSVKRDLLQCQKRPTTVSKEAYYREGTGKRGKRLSKFARAVRALQSP